MTALRRARVAFAKRHAKDGMPLDAWAASRTTRPSLSVGRHVRICPADLDAFIAAGRVTALRRKAG